MSNQFMEKPVGSSAWNAWGSNEGSSFGPTILSNQVSVDAERFAEKLKKGSEEVALKMEYVPSAVSKMENGNKRIMFSAEEVIKDGQACTLQLYGYFVGTSMDYHVVREKTEPSSIPIWNDERSVLKKARKLDFARVLVEVSANEELPNVLEIAYPPIGNREAKVGKNNKSSNRGNGKGGLSKSGHSSGIVRPSQQRDSNQGNSSFGYGKYGNQQRYSYDKQ
nr:hypothetical protein [Tanacetum cinerariifolium]